MIKVLAEGEFIKFLDKDCPLKKEYCRKVKEIFKYYIPGATYHQEIEICEWFSFKYNEFVYECILPNSVEFLNNDRHNT